MNIEEWFQVTEVYKFSLCCEKNVLIGNINDRALLAQFLSGFLVFVESSFPLILYKVAGLGIDRHGS